MRRSRIINWETVLSPVSWDFFQGWAWSLDMRGDCVEECIGVRLERWSLLG